MALPKEPRQKMINMMYLVLTALLAINVSAEILNAFKTVDGSINRSNNLIDNKSKSELTAFDKAIKDQGEAKVLPFKMNALAAVEIEKRASSFIENLKLQIKMASGGKAPDGEEYKDDYMDGPTRIMDNQKKGIALRDSILAWRNELLELAPNGRKSVLEETLPLKLDTPKVENKGNRDWVGAHFRMVPAVAAVTILDKFKNDVKASSASIVEDNLSQINALDIKLDQFEPYVSANSLYLMNGQQFQATIGVGAFSSAVNPEITVDGAPLSVANGKGVYSATASGSGSHTLHVHIRMRKPDNTYLEKDEDITYNVGSSTFAVSADLTKVLFRGIDNPISVSGGGVGAEGLSVSASNGPCTKIGAGKYMLKPGEGSEDRVTVTAHRPDGSTSNLGSESFQVKDLPNPTAYVGTNSGGRMRAAEFRANGGLRAVLENFDFVSGIRFEVTSFTMYCQGGDFNGLQQGTSNSFSFTPVMNLVSKCKPGTAVSFEDIHAKGPDGRTRKLKSVSFLLY
ncbi:type IX secretion system motor protein PorM/GldM [Dinghuibacter silviterrae]|uniref:Gliding motility-associated protein GldM n=1 Tax=Dinghuibacter silviterrae TaxID=1539049 RepID=A0A4R8DRP9_9BACT|nr:gliding motility protein GldM [Dinghuibacter silviterrae]TDX00095.1 gliding motility-associated protein GldM [Dinghuibacter silviterrae]